MPAFAHYCFIYNYIHMTTQAIINVADATQAPAPFNVFTARQLDKIPQLNDLPDELVHDMKVVSAVLPFRVNQYVIDHLIDWQNPIEDPIFQLTFPQRGMLKPEHFTRVEKAMASGDKVQIKQVVEEVRETLNPHPAGQLEHNIPRVNGEPVNGIQHKYHETVLFFPSSGQVCHSY